MDEVRFNEEQAALASEIRQIDRQLDEFDEHALKSIQWGAARQRYRYWRACAREGTAA